jgi:hypothetical protein
MTRKKALKATEAAVQTANSEQALFSAEEGAALSAPPAEVGMRRHHAFAVLRFGTT